MNSMPNGWVKEKLGNCALLITKGGTPTSYGHDYQTSGIPFVRVENLRSGRIDSESITQFIDLAADETLKRSRLNAEDVLLSIAGTIGRCAIVDTKNVPANTNQAIAIIRGVTTIYVPQFLVQLLTSVVAQQQMAGVARGGGMNNVSLEDVRNLQLPIPPIAEQSRITSKIDELLSDLDAGVAALERARANLKRYRAAVLKAAVEGRLTAECRKAHPDVEPASKLLERILAERRGKWEEAQLAKFAAQGKEPPKGWKDKYPEPAKLETTDLPELPDGWLWMTLDTICEIAGGLTKGGKRKPHEKTRAVPYLRVANVQRGFLDLSEMKTIQATDVEIEELTLKAGDILFNEGGDRDKLGRGWVWAGEIDSCVHQNHVFRARPVFAEIQSKFVSFHGNTFGKNWFQKHGKQSVNLASINMTMLRQFPVPVPPAAEQARIIEELDSRLTALDYTENQLDDGLARATRLRQSILKRAFEGKLVPQDPSDEPASVLLERIRDARAATVPAPRIGKRSNPARGRAQ